jgi:hypothetical protein
MSKSKHDLTLYGENRDEWLTVRLTKDELYDLNNLASRLGLSRSETVRKLISFDALIFRVAFIDASARKVSKGQAAAEKIRAEYEKGNVTLKQLGEKYDYSESAVSLIVRGKRLGRSGQAVSQ